MRDKEKKRREEERKEIEKKAKKEEERQKAAEAKASKRDGRLSKRPPPAAMDTQRMPTELRRNSMLSTLSGQNSQENSRPTSRDRRRLSGLSFGSTKSKDRSQSTPPTSTEIDGTTPGDWQPVVSTAAPQLPALHGIGWQSRNGSSGGSKSNSWGSDASYTKELSRLSLRLSRNSPRTSPQQASFSENLGPTRQGLSPPRPLLRSQTDNDISTVSHDSPVVKEVEQALAQRRNSSDRSGSGHDQHPSMNGRAAEAREGAQTEDAANGMSAGGSSASTQRNEQKQQLNPLQQHSTNRPSLDGSSYVHRQRMYQQQRSLAGFHEEEAVRDANRIMDEEETSQSEEEASSPPLQAIEQPQPDLKATMPNGNVPAPQVVRPNEEHPDQYHTFLKESRDSDTASKPQPQSTSKMDRILGFGRRPKPSKHSSMITTKSGVSEGSEKIVLSQLPSLENPRQENKARLSKAERMFGEPPPESASPQTPKARTKLSQAIVDKEISPKAKERTPVQGRSRASQVAAVVKTSPPRENGVPRLPSQSRISHAVLDKLPEVEEGPLVRSHSRTRTSSSQLLNDNISMSRPIARSTTAPVLPTINMHPFQGNTDDCAAEKTKAAISPSSHSSVQSFSTALDSSPRVKGPQSPPGSQPPTKAVPEVVVESVTSEGVVRKTSIKRPRSNPQLQSVTPTPPMPSLDFLPQLKHQPLTKPKPRSNLNPTSPDGSKPSHYQFPVPAAVQFNTIPTSNSAPNLAPGRSWGHRPLSHHALGTETALAQRDPRRELGNRMSTQGPFSYAGAEKELDKPLAKMFVICCSCRFWHDLPSRVYEAMAVTKTLQREKTQLRDEGEVEEAKLDTLVECPWCQHHMSIECCAGWTAVVYLHQRHH